MTNPSHYEPSRGRYKKTSTKWVPLDYTWCMRHDAENQPPLLPARNYWYKAHTAHVKTGPSKHTKIDVRGGLCGGIVDSRLSTATYSNGLFGWTANSSGFLRGGKNPDGLWYTYHKDPNDGPFGQSNWSPEPSGYWDYPSNPHGGIGVASLSYITTTILNVSSEIRIDSSFLGILVMSGSDIAIIKIQRYSSPTNIFSSNAKETVYFYASTSNTTGHSKTSINADYTLIKHSANGPDVPSNDPSKKLKNILKNARQNGHYLRVTYTTYPT